MPFVNKINVMVDVDLMDTMYEVHFDFVSPS